MIATLRLFLRPITRDEALRGVEGHAPDDLTYAEGYPNEDALEALQRVVETPDASSIGFSIVRREQRDIIGGIGYWFPAEPNRPSVGYDVVESLQGRGYATEALRGLLGYLFSQPDIDAVEADTLQSNIASQRVLEKAGLSRIAPRHLVQEDDPSTFLFYEITRPRLRAEV